MTTLKNSLVVVGGRDKQDKDYKVTDEIFSLSGEKLTLLTQMITPRFAAAAIGYKEYLIIVGGSNNEKGKDNTLNSTELYDSKSARGQWFITNNLMEPCWGLQSVIIGNKLYLLGGMSEEKKPVKTVFTASLDSLSYHVLNWEPKQDTVWCRSYPVVMQGTNLLLVGGYNQTEGPSPVYTRTNEIWQYGDDKRPSVVGHIPFERSAPVAVSIDENTLIVIGGKRNGRPNNFGYLTNTVWIGKIES